MKEAIVHPNGHVVLHDVSIPKPGPHDILVKVVATGINQKDFFYPVILNNPHNSADDIAGYVEAIGDQVVGFHKGDRVAGMHRMPEPNGGFAEFAILPDYSTFVIPESISFEQAATLPVNYLAAAIAQSWILGLPLPWDRIRNQKTPLLIYGASTTVGGFAIQLASASNIHPVIAVGSTTSSYITDLLDSAKGDVFINYHEHSSPESLIKAIRASLPAGERIFHAIDTVSQVGTYDVVSAAIAGLPRDGDGLKPKVALLMPVKDTSLIDASVASETVSNGTMMKGTEDSKRHVAAVFAMAAWGLVDGWLRPHPHEVIIGGLEGVEQALKDLKGGKVRAKKLVVNVSHTPGL